MRYLCIALIAAVLLPQTANAGLRVFACEPEWGALAKALGGEQVDVYTATTAQQDPHYIQARPSLIAKARRADMLLCTGADLEVGWLPLLLRQTGNPKIQRGQPGHLMAADHVTLLEAPARIDRREGDIHPYGNPHIHLDPRNIGRVATVVEARLSTLDPSNAQYYRRHGSDFSSRWHAATKRWEQRGLPLRGFRIVTHHSSWTYMVAWLGLEVGGNLEPKPGIPPSAAHLSQLLELVRQKPATAIVRAPFESPKPAAWLAERTKLPVVVLPFTVGGNVKAKDLFALFDETLDQLLAAGGR